MPSLEEDENPELVDFRRRFWWTLPLTVAVTVLAMFGHRLQLVRHGAPRAGSSSCCPRRSCCGRAGRSSCAGAQSIVNRSPNMWTLIGLGTGAAFVYSVVATVAPACFPASFVSMGRVAVYFEAAAVIISLTLLGQLLELQGALADLGGDQVAARPGAEDGAPHRRRRQRGGRAARRTCTSAIVLRVRPARRCRSTASCVEGSSAVDESMLTGEPMPVTKRPGDKLIGATMNTSGALVMRAERVGAQTVLAQIVQMVAQAQRSRAPMQRMADRVAGWFVLGGDRHRAR